MDAARPVRHRRSHRSNAVLMNVQQLIAVLAKYPPDFPVWHDGGGDPYCAGEIIDTATFAFPFDKKMFGHEDVLPGSNVVMLS